MSCGVGHYTQNPGMNKGWFVDAIASRELIMLLGKSVSQSQGWNIKYDGVNLNTFIRSFTDWFIYMHTIWSIHVLEVFKLQATSLKKLMSIDR